MVNNLEFVQMDWRINNIRRGLVRSVCSTRVAIPLLLPPITRGRNMARSAGWMDGGRADVCHKDTHYLESVIVLQKAKYRREASRFLFFIKRAAVSLQFSNNRDKKRGSLVSIGMLFLSPRKF